MQKLIVWMFTSENAGLFFVTKGENAVLVHENGKN
jgi:ABC-type uncharacterized transport system permease subunit